MTTTTEKYIETQWQGRVCTTYNQNLHIYGSKSQVQENTPHIHPLGQNLLAVRNTQSPVQLGRVSYNLVTFRFILQYYPQKMLMPR